MQSSRTVLDMSPVKFMLLILITVQFIFVKVMILPIRILLSFLVFLCYSSLPFLLCVTLHTGMRVLHRFLSPTFTFLLQLA